MRSNTSLKTSRRRAIWRWKRSSGRRKAMPASSIQEAARRKPMMGLTAESGDDLIVLAEGNRTVHQP